MTLNFTDPVFNPFLQLSMRQVLLQSQGEFRAITNELSFAVGTPVLMRFVRISDNDSLLRKSLLYVIGRQSVVMMRIVVVSPGN